ncbi:MAG: M28 family peptidase [Halobacteriaceae archaeon]
MPEWIGDTFTSDVGWSHLETLVDIGDRMAGSTGEREAAEATRDAFAEYARDAHLDEFSIQGWARGESRLEAGDTTLDCIALPRSPSATVEGELVDLGYGLPEDYEDADIDGAVVMVRSDVPAWFDRYLHRREKYYRAVEAGAAAFVYRNHVEGQLPPTGSVGTEDDPIGPIPAVGVSNEVGARLARRWTGDAITVGVDADISAATSQNVHADLGPDTEAAVYLTSHVDAHDIAEGALDNGAGTATVLEVARALAAREDELDTRVHLVAFGAEEVGLDGSQHEADRVDPESVKTVLNLDGVVRGRTLSMTTHGFDALAEAIEEVADRHRHPITVSPKLGPHSDHWPFVEDGLPGVHVMSETGSQGRGWGHTQADTLDKLDIRDLREQAVLLTDLTVAFAADDLEAEPVKESTIADALEDQDLAEGMKLIGDWPF